MLKLETELKPCKYCGGFPKLHEKKRRFFLECDGDCWFATGKHLSVDCAIKQWNEMQEEEYGKSDSLR